MSNRTGFLTELIEHKILIPTGVAGIYGRSGVLEHVIDRFDRLALAFGEGETTESVYFPPGMNRGVFEKSGYFSKFPHLAGTVHCFCGGEGEHVHALEQLAAGEDWTEDQEAGDVVLTPAACYPLYPIIARRGPLPVNGVTVALSSYCFRNEVSADPARMQMFRMREFVCIGKPDDVQSFRERWMERGQAFGDMLMLPGRIEVATDQFFGRAGTVLSSSQRDLGLKYEFVLPIAWHEKSTACMSFNYHQDHFGELWDISCADGTRAHSACVGFGLERIALALFRHHGFDVAAWPQRVRESLWS